jgi:hypothetical protein
LRLIRFFIFLIFAGLVLLFVYREPLLKNAIKLAAGEITGFSVEVDKLEVGFFSPVINIRGLRIYNPPGFPDRLMLDMPQLMVRYVPQEVIKGKLAFEVLKIDLDEFQVVKAKDGSTNIGQLKGIAPSGKSTVPTKPLVLKIDILKLKVNKVVYRDYSVAPPLVKTFTININKEFHDVNDPAKLVRLIVVESLLKTGLNDFSDVNLGTLESDVKTILVSGRDLVVGTASLATGVARGTVHIVKKSVEALGSLLSFKRQ